jgi:hypothetical protein
VVEWAAVNQHLSVVDWKSLLSNTPMIHNWNVFKTTLQDRPSLMNLLFLYKISHNLIDYCSLLSQINFCVGRHFITTRSKNVFYLPTPRTVFLKFSPLYNMLNIFKSVCDLVDQFSSNIELLNCLIVNLYWSNCACTLIGIFSC